MKIKLNRSKIEGLLQVTTYLLFIRNPENKAEKILHCLVNQIRIKMRNRLEQVNLKNSYQINLSEHEAIAFELWFTQVIMKQVLIPPKYQYEQYIAQQICGEIDKTYGTNFNK